jgi:hypothetical protein
MKSYAAAAALILLLPALALAQKTSFDYDKTADFTTMKSYTLKDGTKVGDPFVDDRITAAIEAELKAKGLTRNDATPDVVVVYHITFDKQKDITAYSTGAMYGPYPYRWGGGWGGGTTNVRVNEILVGTLIIDVADAHKEQVVFRGMGVKEVDVQAKAEKRDKNVATAVKKVLKGFPPKKKS